MIDRTTQGLVADPNEVQAVLLNVCRFHLAERDPVARYQALTQEQVLYDGLVAAIRRERGRALAELLAAGQKLSDIADATGLGTRQRVQRLIQAVREGDGDGDEPQTVRLAAARDFDERLAAVEATLDAVVGPSTAEMFFPSFDGPPLDGPPLDGPPFDDSPIDGPSFGDPPFDNRSLGDNDLDGDPLADDSLADDDLVLEPTPPAIATADPVAGTHRAPDHDPTGDPAAVGVPTQAMPVLSAALQKTRELPTEEDGVLWWRLGGDGVA